MLSVNELERFYERLVDCQHPIDLFGPLSEDKDKDEAKDALRKLRKEFLQMCHPDRYQNEEARVVHISTESTSLVNKFYVDALTSITTGVYWDRKSFRTTGTPRTTIKTATREYSIYSKIATGSLADVFLADYTEDGSTERVAIKVVSDTDDNSLIRNEQQILRSIRHKSMPTLVESFTTTEGKDASVLRYVDGYDLYALRENPIYKDGVPVEHMCWIFERQLSVLGFVHSNIVIHGNIEPGNIIVRPLDHNAFLTDFTFSVSNPKDGDYIKCVTPGYSAPEVAKKVQPLPTADLYALGKCMIYLVGGNVDTGAIPDHVDHRIAQFLERLIAPDYQTRPRDAWEMHEELVDLRTEVFGKERFKALHI